MAEILLNFGSKIQISGPFRTVLLEWFSPEIATYSAKLLRSIDSEPTYRAFKIKSNILLVTTIVVVLQMVFDLTRNSGSIQSIMTCCVTIMILSFSYIVIHLCRMFASQIALLINGLIQFDHLYEKRKRNFRNMSVLEILNKIMTKSAFWAQLLIPAGFVVGLHWNNPWKASLAGYWVIPKPSYLETGTLAQVLILIIKFVVMLFNVWIWMFGVNGPVFLVAVIYTSCHAFLLLNIET